MTLSRDIAKVLAGLNDPRDMERFLNELLTPAERRTVALRWKLMTLLHRGLPQRDIAARLGISLCKITRGSRIVKNPRSVTRSVLEGNSHEHISPDRRD